MRETQRKLALGENHRRVVSVVLRGTERASAGVLEWLDRPSGLLHRYEDDLSATEASELRTLAARLDAEIHHIAEGIELDRARQSRRRAIAALVSAARSDIEEVSAQRLNAYGPIPKETAEDVEHRLARLLPLLETMSDIVERAEG